MRCEGCLKSDCGTCSNCKDMKKFGGTGSKKKGCLHRICAAGRIIKVKGVLYI